jgi:Fe-S-cluster containining protein
MDATGRPAREIVQFFTPSDFESSPGPVAWTRLGRGDRRVMCLRESGDRCFFLRRKRCTVYAHRPIVCREHPFDLTLDDSERRIEVVELNLPCECLHTMDGKTSKREIKKIHRLSLQQDADYFALVRKWNRQAKRGTERDFLKFTGLGD